MKILYIGHYKENTGWAEAAKNYILAMDSVGLNVACRNVTLTKDNQNINKRILELEKKDIEDCDYCIQHVLPHHLVGSKKFKKNIAFFVSESTSIKHLAWLNHLQQMDEVWVPNNDLSESLKSDKLNLPIKIIPHAFDIEKYTKKYNEIDIPQARDTFKFYYIGDLNDRKNIRSIIRCFHSEFNRSEPVSFIFKIKKFGLSPVDLSKHFDNILLEEKKRLRLYKNIDSYIKEIVISENTSENNIYSLHQYADCFICPSHGEAWSIPSFEAMAFGNTPICSNFGGPKDFIDKNNIKTGFCVNGVYSICQCEDAAFQDIFTGREYWFQPCEKSIREKMRFYYENKNKVKNAIAGLTRAKEFSYENIGKIIKGALNENN